MSVSLQQAINGSSVSVNDRYEDSRDVSLLAKDQYFREIRWTTPLEDGEEEKLLGRLLRAYREPDNAWVAKLAGVARDRLVEVYQSLVVKIATRAQSRFRGMELLDLVGEGNLGLLEAIGEYPGREDFHHERGFFKLAASCIQHALYRARCDRDSMVRLPRNVHMVLNQKRKAVRELSGVLGRAPERSEVAEVLGMDEGRLSEVVSHEQRQYAESLQGLLVADDAEDRYNFVSVFQAEVAAGMGRQEALEEMFEQVLEQVLTERQRKAVMLRYGFGDQLGAVRSYIKVGEMLGVECGAVCRVEKQALKKLRQVIQQDGTGGYTSSVVAQPSWDDYYTTDEAAQVIGVSCSRVWRLRTLGWLPVVERWGGAGGKQLMFPKEAVHAYVAERAALVQERQLISA